MTDDEFYFEDLGPGIEFSSEAHTITDQDIRRFAELSGDDHPLHLDEDFAATTQYGSRVAHGTLVLAIATGLAQQIGHFYKFVEALTQVHWKFQGPVRIGDEIRVHLKFRRKRSLPGYQGGLVFFETAILNQDDEVVQQGTWTLLVHGREATA
ncbi:MAG: MaoC family dehydratase [Anaerolineae bacterium]